MEPKKLFDMTRDELEDYAADVDRRNITREAIDAWNSLVHAWRKGFTVIDTEEFKALRLHLASLTLSVRACGLAMPWEVARGR